MGKKMKLPFPTLYCHLQPRTSSFRTSDKMLLKTINSPYLDATINGATAEPESLFTNSSKSSASFTTESDESGGGDDPIETVIRGARSERLFFKPGETSSILEEAPSKAAAAGEAPFKESLVLSMESYDPYLDFKKSMEEMVKAYGLKDWEDLEELLFSYLKMNGRSNHGYIIGAFVDLLVALAFVSPSSPSAAAPNSSLSCSCSRSPTSPLSFYTSSSSSSSSSDDCSSTTPCVSSVDQEPEEEIIDISPCHSSLEVEDENVIKQT